MTFQRIKRKLHNLTHPVVGEVWMLHRVVEQRSVKPEQRDLEVTPAWLEQKINDYRAKGWKFVSIDNLPKKGRWVCITFDDGYRDNYTLAYPLLKQLDVPFAVYVSTGFLDNHNEMWWYPGQQLAMSTDELKTLDTDSLCTIGAHTVNHLKLDSLSVEQQISEIKNSKDELEQLLGHPIRHFSFPHGAHNDDTINICQELGFQTVAKSWGGPLRRGASRRVLNRIETIQP